MVTSRILESWEVVAQMRIPPLLLYRLHRSPLATLRIAERSSRWKSLRRNCRRPSNPLQVPMTYSNHKNVRQAWSQACSGTWLKQHDPCCVHRAQSWLKDSNHPPSRLHLDPEELTRYTHLDDSKNYTRNLVATDNTHYTLMLLCWNPGKSSPIHDHPCDGCWMQVLEGQVRECRYERTKNGVLKCYSDETFYGTSFPCWGDMASWAHLILIAIFVISFVLCRGPTTTH